MARWRKSKTQPFSLQASRVVAHLRNHVTHDQVHPEVRAAWAEPELHAEHLDGAPPPPPPPALPRGVVKLEAALAECPLDVGKGLCPAGHGLDGFDPDLGG